MRREGVVRRRTDFGYEKTGRKEGRKEGRKGWREGGREESGNRRLANCLREAEGGCNGEGIGAQGGKA